MFGSVPDDHFQATSNARNEAMFKEAADFSLHLRTMEKDLRAMERQMTGARMHERMGPCAWAHAAWGSPCTPEAMRRLDHTV